MVPQMKRQSIKYRLSDIILTVFLWLMAAAIVYIIYLKIKLL